MNYSDLTLITILLFIHHVISKNDRQQNENSLDYGGPTHNRFKCNSFERLRKCGCSCMEKCENRLNPNACPHNEKPKKACYCLKGFFRDSKGNCVPADQCDGGFTDTPDAPDHLLNKESGQYTSGEAVPKPSTRAVKRNIRPNDEQPSDRDDQSDFSDEYPNLERDSSNRLSDQPPGEFGRNSDDFEPVNREGYRIEKLSESGQSGETDQSPSKSDLSDDYSNLERDSSNRLSDQPPETNQLGPNSDEFERPNEQSNRINRLSESGQSAETGQSPSKTSFEDFANDGSPESEDCGPNEKFTQCGNKCQESLDYIQNKKTCSHVCETGCFCRSGYFRDGFNNCNKVEEKYLVGIIAGTTKKAPEKECIRVNEYYNDCGDRCIESLFNLYNHTLCEPYQCLRGCYCVNDYLRNADGICVPAKRPNKPGKKDEDEEEKEDDDEDEDDEEVEGTHEGSRIGPEGKSRERERHTQSERDRERHRGGGDDIHRERKRHMDRGRDRELEREEERDSQWNGDRERHRERHFPRYFHRRFIPERRPPPPRPPPPFRRGDHVPSRPFFPSSHERKPLRKLRSHPRLAECPPKEIHSNCGNRCMESIDNYYNPGKCNPNRCDSGCFCAPVLFRNRRGHCVEPQPRHGRHSGRG